MIIYKYIILSFFVLFAVIPINSVEIIEPSFTFNPGNDIDIRNPENTFPTKYIGHLFFDNDNPNIINMWYQGMNYLNEAPASMQIYKGVIQRWNLKSNSAEDIMVADALITSITHDHSSVIDVPFPDNQNLNRIYLERSYLPQYEFGDNNVEFNKTGIEASPDIIFHNLSYVINSPSKSFFGGIITYTYRRNYKNFHTTYYQPAIWKNNGELIFRQNYIMDVGGGWYGTNLPIDLGFSEDGNYFWVRGFIGTKGPMMHLNLFDIQDENPTYWKALRADKDISFSSDGSYLITEWEGLPTLFASDNYGVPIRQFQISEDLIMSSCTFSPEDMQIYIATYTIDSSWDDTIRDIHVFPSGLETSVQDWPKQD